MAQLAQKLRQASFWQMALPQLSSSSLVSGSPAEVVLLVPALAKPLGEVRAAPALAKEVQKKVWAFALPAVAEVSLELEHPSAEPPSVRHRPDHPADQPADQPTASPLAERERGGHYLSHLIPRELGPKAAKKNPLELGLELGLRKSSVDRGKEMETW